VISDSTGLVDATGPRTDRHSTVLARTSAEDRSGGARNRTCAANGDSLWTHAERRGSAAPHAMRSATTQCAAQATCHRTHPSPHCSLPPTQLMSVHVHVHVLGARISQL
jgi:hypothetical protein